MTPKQFVAEFRSIWPDAKRFATELYLPTEPVREMYRSYLPKLESAQTVTDVHNTYLNLESGKEELPSTSDIYRAKWTHTRANTRPHELLTILMDVRSSKDAFVPSMHSKIGPKGEANLTALLGKLPGLRSQYSARPSSDTVQLWTLQEQADTNRLLGKFMKIIDTLTPSVTTCQSAVHEDPTNTSVGDDA